MKEEENTIFVLGGGRTRLTAVRDLATSHHVERVVVEGIDTVKADQLASAVRSDKMEVTKVDLTNHDGLVAAIQQSKALINATWCEYNVDVMEATIEAESLRRGSERNIAFVRDVG